VTKGKLPCVHPTLPLIVYFGLASFDVKRTHNITIDRFILAAGIAPATGGEAYPGEDCAYFNT
jgi:hypothetical protein